MRAVIFGGRAFNDWDRFVRGVAGIWTTRGPLTCVIEGGATGADWFGRYLAEQWGIPHEPFPAAWSKINVPDALIRQRHDGTLYNARAGFIRNQQMIEDGRPDVGIRCPGGTGTADMSRRLILANIEILDI